MKNLKRNVMKNILSLFAGAVVALCGISLLISCDSQTKKNYDVINCSYPMGENQKLEYEFKFNEDKLEKMEVYIKTSLKDATDEAYKETKDATKDVVAKQNTFKGVEASYELDDEEKIISETIKIDMPKYDIKKDGLELFGDKEYKEITPDFVKEKYKEDGFSITVNGEELLDK